ncbi:MAG: cell division protein ZapE [Rhodocyclaceae bacterium]
MPHSHAARTRIPERFRDACAARGIEADAAQLAAAHRMQRLYEELMAFKHARRTRLRKLLIHPPVPRGIYLWGEVGRGKSLLMNFFYDLLPYRRKRRVHFHAFMREVHEGLRRLRGEADPLPVLCAGIARETRFLCFDEFHVSDIADAMILARMLDALIGRGVVFCITSNYPPAGLYRDGLQRESFLPAIALIERHLDVIEVDSGIDYRRRAFGALDAWRTGAGREADAALAGSFRELAGGPGHERAVEVLGRSLAVRRRGLGVIWFDFGVLCGPGRSQNDYLEIARRYRAVLVSGVPRMSPAQADEARRFAWLVDVFYDRAVKLVVAAECEPDELYREGLQAGEFRRTASRLAEMRTRAWLALPHRAD